MGTILRYVFGLSYEWVEESCRYLILSAVFLVSAPMVYQEKHITLDLISKNIKGRLRIIYNYFSTIYVSIIAICFTVWGIELMLKFRFMQSFSLAFPMWIPYLTLPLGMIFMIFYSFIKIIKIYSNKYIENDIQEKEEGEIL